MLRVWIRPESQGLICAAVYILFLILFIPFAFSDVVMNFHQEETNKPPSGLVVREFPHHQVSKLIRITQMLGTQGRTSSSAISLPVISVIPLDCHYAGVLGRRI